MPVLDANRQGRTKGPWEPTAEQLEIYAAVCRGDRSQQQIGDAYDVTQQRISSLAARIDKWLAPQLMEQIRELKAGHTSRLMHIYQEAMRAWERSKTPGKQRTVKHGKDGVERTRVTRFQSGDPRYLDQARAALAEIRKIWGADAPLKVEHSGEVRVAGRDVDEARSELFERMQRALEVQN